MAKIVVGVFDDLAVANEITRELVGLGILASHVSVVRQEKGRGLSESHGVLDLDGKPDVTRSVAATGGAVGGTMSAELSHALAGLEPIEMSGIGPSYVTGELSKWFGQEAKLSLVNALIKHGVPGEEARFYAMEVRHGATLIVTELPESVAARAAEVMREHGAIDCAARRELHRIHGYGTFEEHVAPATREEIARHRELCRTVPCDELAASVEPARKVGARRA